MLKVKHRQEQGGERFDLPTFCSDLSQSTDIKSACMLIEDQLQSMGYNLLSVKFCDTLDEKPAVRPFSRYPKAISELSAALRAQGGCPISKEVLTRLSPFDAKTIEMVNYSGFLDARFLQELAKMEHQHIAVIPIIFGRGLAVYTVGMKGHRFVDGTREEIVNFVCNANAVLLCTFPEIATLFEPKKLTLLEAQIVSLFGNGNSLSEISTTTGLSDITVNMILNLAAEKLGARNQAHLLTRALATGEILNMQSG